LHLRIETFANIAALSSIRNLTKLTLISNKNTCDCRHDDCERLDLTTLESLRTLEIVGYSTRGGSTRGGACDHTDLAFLKSNSLELLDVTDAGKGFSIIILRCPELRLVKTGCIGTCSTNIQLHLLLIEN
jgi:hypothetical protein